MLLVRIYSHERYVEFVFHVSIFFKFNSWVFDAFWGFLLARQGKSSNPADPSASAQPFLLRLFALAKGGLSMQAGLLRLHPSQ